MSTESVFRFERGQEKGWDRRYLYIGRRVLIGWATVIKGEPWEGPWIGLRITRNAIRFGVRGFACAIGVAK